MTVICKNCEHYKTHFFRKSTCESPNVSVDTVTGRKVTLTCYDSRWKSTWCGPGNWYLEKQVTEQSVTFFTKVVDYLKEVGNQ